MLLTALQVGNTYPCTIVMVAYSETALDVARIPVMDKTGASMIVERHDGQVVFLEEDEAFQVSTNLVERGALEDAVTLLEGLL